MVEHHFDDEDEWLGPRASCIVHDVPLERTYDVGGNFDGVGQLLNGNYALRYALLCTIMHNA